MFVKVNVMIAIYILLAAFSWCALSFLRKLSVAHVPNSVLLVLMSSGGAIVCTIWAVLFHDSLWYVEGYLFWGFLSILMNTVANYLFLVAMRYGDFNQTIPFLSFIPAVALVVSPLIGEYATAQQIVGILSVCTGGLLLNRRNAGQGGFFMGIVQALLANRGGLCMLVAAGILGSLTVVDKVALRHASTPLHGMMVTYGLFICFALMTILRSPITFREVIGKLGRKALFIPLSAAGGIVFSLIVIQQFPVALFEAILKPLESFSSLILGYLFLKEEVGIQQVFAVVVMCVGVGLILL